MPIPSSNASPSRLPEANRGGVPSLGSYQHRAIRGDVSLLLTDYNQPYYKDHPLPVGRLREYRRGDKRADLIIVTKCPETLTLKMKTEMIKAINPGAHQHVFFSAVKPGKPYALKGEIDFDDVKCKSIIAMSGIANPVSFIALCRQFKQPLIPMNYRDHHDYSTNDIKKLKELIGNDTIVMTTEKDAVKLGDKKLLELLPENKVFVLPIKTLFLFNAEARMKDLVKVLLSRS